MHRNQDPSNIRATSLTNPSPPSSIVFSVSASGSASAAFGTAGGAAAAGTAAGAAGAAGAGAAARSGVATGWRRAGLGVMALMALVLVLVSFTVQVSTSQHRLRIGAWKVQCRPF